jgi:predicted metal-dependent hydrolase
VSPKESAISLFQAGRYFEAHEVWEEQWRTLLRSSALDCGVWHLLLA